MDEGGGAEPSLETQPKVLTPRDLEKIASILGMNHAPSTRAEYASQVASGNTPQSREKRLAEGGPAAELAADLPRELAAGLTPAAAQNNRSKQRSNSEAKTWCWQRSWQEGWEQGGEQGWGQT